MSLFCKIGLHRFRGRISWPLVWVDGNTYWETFCTRCGKKHLYEAQSNDICQMPEDAMRVAQQRTESQSHD